MPPEVAKVFAAYPRPVRQKFVTVRQLILKTAAADEAIGPIEETTKWGEPAYLTTATGSGTTVRLGWKPAKPDRFAVLFHCRTTLVDDFRTLFADELDFEGNRAILLRVADPVPKKPLAACIAMALTYHRTKK